MVKVHEILVGLGDCAYCQLFCDLCAKRAKLTLTDIRLTKSKTLLEARSLEQSL